PHVARVLVQEARVAREGEAAGRRFDLAHLREQRLERAHDGLGVLDPLERVQVTPPRDVREGEDGRSQKERQRPGDALGSEPGGHRVVPIPTGSARPAVKPPGAHRGPKSGAPAHLFLPWRPWAKTQTVRTVALGSRGAHSNPAMQGEGAALEGRV